MEFIRVINKNIRVRVWVREFLSFCFSLTPACPSSLVLIGTTWIFSTLIMFVSCLGIAGEAFPEVLHPSGRLWVVLFHRSLFLSPREMLALG